MPDPLDTNDDWAELARELDRNKPPAPAPAPPADMVERQTEAEAVEPHHGFDPRVEDEAVAEGEPEAADEEFDDAEDGGSGEAESTPEGQPGTGRKRRRRRRRRRKGGAPEAAPVAGGEAEGAEAEIEVEPAAEESGSEAEEFGGEDMESESAPLAAEEDTASEVLRDLIENWNVPSWDDIVGGLYRPN
jgi:ribonuclease E